jgi:signal transduction histidine kinase/PAS domain-containing protein
MELTTETLRFIEDAVPGNAAVYRINGDKIETLYIAPTLPKLNGMTSEEYRTVTGGNAANIVLPDDLPGLMEAVRDCLTTGQPLDCYYRVLHKRNGFDWVHATARQCGVMNGKPVLLVLYTNASVETDIYQNILNHSNNMVYVCDRHTRKLLYANSAALKLKKGSGSLAGTTCFAYMQGKNEPCKDCVLDAGARKEPLCEKRYDPKRGKWEQITGEFVNWCGHDAFVHYISDITESESKKQELQNILSAEENLLKAVQILCGPGPIDKRQNDLLAFIGTSYNADRVYIFEKDEGGATISNTYEWCREGVAPQIDAQKNYDANLMAPWLSDFEKQRAVMVPDIEEIRETQPVVYEIMAKQNIRSYAEAPLLTGGELTGFIGIDNPLPSLTKNFGELLLSLAYAVSNALERAASERRRLETGHRYQLAVEGADLGIWEYHIKEHRLTNPSNRLIKYGVPKSVENFPAVVLPKVAVQDRGKLLDMYARIDAGAPFATTDVWMKWAVDAPPVCERVIYSVVKDRDGKPGTAYGISIDVTGHKLEQAKFRRSMQALLTANPDSLGTFQLNLTQNTCGEGRRAKQAGVAALASETADEFFASLEALVAETNDRRRFREVFSRAALLKAFAAGSNSMSLDYRRRRENGKSFWSRTYISMLRNPDTRDVEAVIYSSDISKAKREQEIFHIITDQEYDFVALLHADTSKIEFVHMNVQTPQKYRDLFKTQGELYDFDEMRNRAVSTWIDANDRERYLREGNIENIRRELDRNGHYEFTVQEHFEDSPETTMCRKFQHYYLDGGKDTILIIESDVTETYKQQQQEIARSRAEKGHVQDIMDSITSGICVLRMPDCDHLSIDYVNLQLFRMLGFKPLGNTIDQLGEDQNELMAAYFKNAFAGVHPDDLKRVRKTFSDNFYASSFSVGNYRTAGADGKYYWIREDVALREVTPEGRIFYAAYYDVGEEVRLQQELSRRLAEEEKLRKQATAANDAKTEFLSRMSHDIRTPLNGIMGMTHIANREQNPPRTADCLSKIDTSSQFLLGLVNDVLDMAKAESNKIELRPEPYYIETFYSYIDAVIRPLCREKNQKFLLDVSPLADYAPIVDMLRFNQIFFNLLSNSVKYTPEGGSIVCRMHSRLIGHERVCLDASISDNGIGMSEEFQKVLFEPFSQEHRSDVSEKRGSGLGLAIVKRMTELMGGAISVRSKLGEGTMFALRFEFNCAKIDRTKDGKTAAPTGDACSLKDCRVLLCEDHPINQEIALALLAEKDIVADAAENGRSGLELFSRSPEGFYKAVLMDIRMPVMDGYEAAQAIRALPRKDAKLVPIIAMTADAFEDDVKKCLAAGMNGHVSKPINPDQLYDELCKAIARHG